MKRRPNNDPKLIQARYTSRCKETGSEILKGDYCLYYPLSKTIYSLQSETYLEWSNWRQDLMNEQRIDLFA